MLYVVVGVAGMIGSILRYYTGLLFHSLWGLPFPVDTLLINAAGSFVLSWFTFISPAWNVPAWFRLGFGTGLIGAFTTFSAFSAETVQLLQTGLWMSAVIYVLLSFWAGLLMAWLGYRVAHSPLIRKRG